MRNLLSRELGAGLTVHAVAASFLALAIVPAIQFATFSICARTLSLPDFGSLVLFQASTGIFLEVAALGMGEVLIRDVARDRSSYRHSLLNFITAFIPTILAALLINSCVQLLSFGVSRTALLGCAFGAAEIVSLRILMLWEQVAIGHGDTSRANRFRLVPAILRVALIVPLGVTSRLSLGQIVAAFVATGLFNAALCTAWGLKAYGTPAGQINIRAMRAGIPFALNQLLRTVQFNADRLILQVILTPAQIGIYAAAIKFVQVGGLPVASMSRIWYPKLFAAGARSRPELHRTARGLLVPAITAAALTAGSLITCAPFLPVLLGSSFQPSVGLLQMAAPVLVITAIGYVIGDVLTGSDRQYMRVFVGMVSIAAQALTLCAFGSFLGSAVGVLGLYVSATAFMFLSKLVVSFREVSDPNLAQT